MLINREKERKKKKEMKNKKEENMKYRMFSHRDIIKAD